MDKKIRNAAIASVVVAILLIVSTVLLLNKLQNPKTDGQKPVLETGSEQVSEEERDEKAFLKDPAFLDSFQPFAGEVREDDAMELSLLVSSVERD